MHTSNLSDVALETHLAAIESSRCGYLAEGNFRHAVLAQAISDSWSSNLAQGAAVRMRRSAYSLIRIIYLLDP